MYVLLLLIEKCILGVSNRSWYIYWFGLARKYKNLGSRWSINSLSDFIFHFRLQNKLLEVHRRLRFLLIKGFCNRSNNRKLQVSTWTSRLSKHLTQYFVGPKRENVPPAAAPTVVKVTKDKKKINSKVIVDSPLNLQLIQCGQKYQVKSLLYP